MNGCVSCQVPGRQDFSLEPDYKTISESTVVSSSAGLPLKASRQWPRGAGAESWGTSESKARAEVCGPITHRHGWIQLLTGHLVDGAGGRTRVKLC